MKLFLVLAALACVASGQLIERDDLGDVCCYNPTVQTSPTSEYISAENQICGSTRNQESSAYNSNDQCNLKNNGNPRPDGPYDIDTRTKAGPRVNLCTDVLEDSNNLGTFSSNTCGCVNPCAWCGACATTAALGRMSPLEQASMPFSMHDLLYFTTVQTFQRWYHARCEAHLAKPNGVSLTRYAKTMVCNQPYTPQFIPGQCGFDPNLQIQFPPCPSTYCNPNVEPDCQDTASIDNINEHWSFHLCGLNYENGAVTDCDDLNLDPKCALRYTIYNQTAFNNTTKIPCRLGLNNCVVNPATAAGATLSSSSAIVAYAVGAAVMAGLIGAIFVVQRLRKRRRHQVLEASSSVESIEMNLNGSHDVPTMLDMTTAGER